MSRTLSPYLGIILVEEIWPSLIFVNGQAKIKSRTILSAEARSEHSCHWQIFKIERKSAP